MLHCTTLWTQDNKIECDGAVYLVTSNGENEPSQLLKIQVDGNGISNTTTVNADLGMSLNATGYSVLDKYIYGINFENNHLIQIDKEGNTIDLGLPPGLNPNLKYYAGDITPNGLQFVLIGRDPNTNFDIEIFYVRMITEDFSTGKLSIVSTIPTRVEDLSFDPLFGSCFGFDNNTKRLISINVFGAIFTSTFNALANVSSVGGLFFDRKGVLYGYGSTGGAENKLMKFDKFLGTITETSTGPISSFTDACTCAYQISFEKEVEPREVLPCGEITVTYRFNNTAGIPQGGIYFLEIFPPEFMIKEMVRGPSLDFLLSSVGSNIFEADLLTVLLGKDSIVLKIDVGDFEGEYENSAELYSFPEALGGDRLSDDPQTLIVDDPTAMQILENNAIFQDDELYFCEESTIYLYAPPADEYLWSTGSSAEFIEITESGFYWLEATSPCEILKDTIELIKVENNLTVNLGEDQTISQGESLLLSYETNASEIASELWTSSDTSLTCSNCPNPLVNPISEQSYNLLIEDEFGCSASDDILVSIDPERKIYVPNVFSPNGDGINDVFYIQGKGTAQINYLRVFNRWGTLVFENRNGFINEKANGWSGEFKSKSAGEEMYLWIAEIKFPDNQIELFSGDLLLMEY